MANPTVRGFIESFIGDQAYFIEQHHIEDTGCRSDRMEKNEADTIPEGAEGDVRLLTAAVRLAQDSGVPASGILESIHTGSQTARRKFGLG